MTGPTGRLRESSFVLHPIRHGAEGNQEEFEFSQPRVAQSVGALREHRVHSPQEDKRELLTDLPFGTRSGRLAAFGRLDESQHLAIAGHNVEVLPDYVDEVVTPEPRKVCHQAIVSASAHTPRKST